MPRDCPGYRRRKRSRWRSGLASLCILLPSGQPRSFAKRPSTGKAPGPRNIYHYQMQTAPPMLSEGLALQYARMTLAKMVRRLPEWKLKRTDEPLGEAPDGTPDKYFESLQLPAN